MTSRTKAVFLRTATAIGVVLPLVLAESAGHAASAASRPEGSPARKGRADVEDPALPLPARLGPTLPGPSRQFPQRTFLVTSADDSGPGSLTQAIIDANASPNQDGPDLILFKIPDPGPHAISLVAALPAITAPVVIDGYSQPGAVPNSLPDGSNAVLMVELDGSRLSRPAHGLLIRAGSSTVRGLRIHGFEGDGIRIEGGGSNRIEGNVLGGGPEETVATSNAGGGVAIVDSSDNVIGGSVPSARNVIEGESKGGVRISGAGSVRNAILGNSIVRNAGEGIDLETDAPEAPRGEGPGPNNLQRPPVLTSVTFSPVGEGRKVEAIIEGMLEGELDGTYRLELFATGAHSAAPRVGAAEEQRRAPPISEGERFLGWVDVTTGGDGKAGFQVLLPRGVRSRDSVTATATDRSGNTSEFSQSVTAPAMTIMWNAGTGNWGTPGNWSPPQVPVAGDDVVIAANGLNTTFTVTVNVAATVNSLTLGGGSGTQTLSMGNQTLTINGASTVNANGVLTQSVGTIGGTGNLTINGTYNWSGGVMTGAATTTINGPFNLSGIAGINGNRTLINASTANWTAGAGQGMWTGTGSVINNTGTWDAPVDGGAIINNYGGVSTFNNSGAFRKSAGSGTTSVSIPFVNTGTVNVQSGTISLGPGSNTNALSVSGASSTLLFASGVFDLNAGTTVSGPGTVRLNSSGTLNVNSAVSFPAGTTFTFMAGTLAGTGAVTTNGTFNWSGGVMTGAATTTVNGAFNLSGLVGINGSRTLNNASTAAWTAGAGQGMWTGTGSVINNTGTWDAQVDGGAIINNYGGASTFNNSGTFRKSAGSGTATVSIPFANTGTVNVQSGTISLSPGSNTNALSVSGATATLLFASGVFDLNAGTTISGPGTVRLYSSGTVNVNSAVSIPAGTTFTFEAGTLGGTAPLTINGPFNWSGGYMTGAGTTTVNGPFNLSGLTSISAGRTLNNASTAVWTSGAGEGMWTGTGSVINNTGTWDLRADGGSIVNHWGGATTFNNLGTFKKSVGSGTATVYIPFINTGSVDVQSGTVNLYGGGSSSAVLNVSGASATLLLNAGTFNLNSGTTVAGPGTVLVNTGGTVNVNGPVTIPAATTFTFLAGTLAGTGSLTTNGTFNWSGGVMTGAAATTVNGPFNLSGLVGILGSRILNNAGTASWTSGSGEGMWTGTGSVINNTGTWDAQVDGGAIVNHYGGATTFNNSGTFKKSAGSGSTSVAIPFFNTGTVDVQSGTLNMSGSNYTQTAGTTKLTGGTLSDTTNINIQGGTLAGSGTVTGPVIVSGTGALAPGLSPGTLSLAGNYTQQAPNGAFNVEIGGTAPGSQFDRADISGTGSVAALAGALNVSLINAFTPAPGDSFTIMTYPSHTGTLTPSFPSLTGCIGWTIRYDPTAIVLSAVALPTEIGGLAFPNKTTLTWNPGPPKAGTTYDLLRGELGKLPVGSQPTSETCLATAIAGTQRTDTTIPIPPSKGFWYLVRERVTGCGVGTYGHASTGAEEVSATCP